MNSKDIEQDISHNQELIQLHTKSLHILELKIAQFGMHSPPYMEIEADMIRQRISICKANIEELKSLLTPQNHNHAMVDYSDISKQRVLMLITEFVINLYRKIGIEKFSSESISRLFLSKSEKMCIKIFYYDALGYINILIGIGVDWQYRSEIYEESINSVSEIYEIIGDYIKNTKDVLNAENMKIVYEEFDIYTAINSIETGFTPKNATEINFAAAKLKELTLIVRHRRS
jgi:hypothetical protein